MADVELVIKIPQETVDEIKDNAMFAGSISSDIRWDITSAIVNGIALPEGHGRLMDYGYVVDAIDDWVNAGEYIYANGIDYLRNRIRNVPTIIEADKENDNADSNEYTQRCY